MPPIYHLSIFGYVDSQLTKYHKILCLMYTSLGLVELGDDIMSLGHSHIV